MSGLGDDVDLPGPDDVDVALPPVGLVAWQRAVPGTGWALIYTFTETRVIVQSARLTGGKT